MRHAKGRGYKTAPQKSPIIYVIQPGQKLLYQKVGHKDWNLNLVDSSVQN